MTTIKLFLTFTLVTVFLGAINGYGQQEQTAPVVEAMPAPDQPAPEEPAAAQGPTPNPDSVADTASNTSNANTATNAINVANVDSNAVADSLLDTTQIHQNRTIFFPGVSSAELPEYYRQFQTDILAKLRIHPNFTPLGFDSLLTHKGPIGEPAPEALLHADWLKSQLTPNLYLQVQVRSHSIAFSRYRWYAWFLGKHTAQITTIWQVQDSTGILLRDTTQVLDTLATGYCGIVLCPEPPLSTKNRALLNEALLHKSLSALDAILKKLRHLPKMDR
jgi:hypothetical protein